MKCRLAEIMSTFVTVGISERRSANVKLYVAVTNGAFTHKVYLTHQVN